MIKLLMAVSCLMLSMAVNAAPVVWNVSDASSVFGTFTTDNGSVTAVDLGVPSIGLDFTQFSPVPITLSYEFSAINGSYAIDVGSPVGFNGLEPVPVSFLVLVLVGSGSTPFIGDNGNATPSPVPIPAAAWLFGSALVGLVGIGRRKKAQV